MSEFLTTRELAALLRVKERKVYDLVAAGSLPVRRVTGKLLFPRDEIELWLGARTADSSAINGDAHRQAARAAPRPAVMAGGHDLLLEWALRDSRSGIAALLDGALDGLERAAAGECIAAGLHIPNGEGWNVDAVHERLGHEPWVLIEWAKRSRGLIVRKTLRAMPRTLREARGLRFLARQPEAGSEVILDQLLAREGLARSDLHIVGIERSESDLVLGLASGRADIGLGLKAAARQFGLGYHPLVEERFDLLVWREAYFDPPFQKFLKFCGDEAFRLKAQNLGGYDISNFGTVHFNAH